MTPIISICQICSTSYLVTPGGAIGICPVCEDAYLHIAQAEKPKKQEQPHK